MAVYIIVVFSLQTVFTCLMGFTVLIFFFGKGVGIHDKAEKNHIDYCDHGFCFVYGKDIKIAFGFNCLTILKPVSQSVYTISSTTCALMLRENQ